MADSAEDREQAYNRAVENFNALRAFLPRFRDSKVYMRAPDRLLPRMLNEIGRLSSTPVTMRDQAVCALLNKATNTHAAIKVLTDAGHGDDAEALGRVLLENVALLRWLLKDRVYRLDLYCISDALFRRRYAQLIQKHYANRPAVVQLAKDGFGPDEQNIAAFFGNTISKWSQLLGPDGSQEYVGIEGMFSELAGGDPTSHTSNFEYEMVYFMLSGYVHSTATVMRSFNALKRAPFFTLEVGPHSTRRDEALGGANIFFWQGLREAADYLGLDDLGTKLDTFFDRLKETGKTNADEFFTEEPDPAA